MSVLGQPREVPMAIHRFAPPRTRPSGRRGGRAHVPRHRRRGRCQRTRGRWNPRPTGDAPARRHVAGRSPRDASPTMRPASASSPSAVPSAWRSAWPSPAPCSAWRTCWCVASCPRRGRCASAGAALFTGAVGGALLVHDHPSFDYSILQPTWLAVTLFLAVPGHLRRSARVPRRVPSPRRTRRVSPARSSRLWHGRAVTVAGTAAYWAFVAWGVYNIGADVVSLASDAASGAPLTI